MMNSSLSLDISAMSKPMGGHSSWMISLCSYHRIKTISDKQNNINAGIWKAKTALNNGVPGDLDLLLQAALHRCCLAHQCPM